MSKPHRTGRRAVALATATTAAALAIPATASAAYTSSISGTTVTLAGDAAGDTLTVSETAGNLSHNLAGTSGFNSATDWDTATAGDQVLPADDTIALVVNAGDGDDAVNITTANLASVTVDGQGGDDVITGFNDNDTLKGGDGDDRVVGARGNDDMEGGNGNDTLVWNNGDGSDVMDGDAGADEIEVNGAPTAGDQFTIKPNGARVRFDRVNLGPFNLDIGSSERMAVNGLGGNDQAIGDPGLAPLIALTLNGGPGDDQLTGGDSADLLLGGDDVDTLAGGGGDDRVVGDRGNDVMSGGAGDDVLVWNNGDGSDRMDGEDGLDRIEVNGGGAAENFTIAPNGARARFDRVSPAPFFLDIGSSEALDLRTAAGDDTFTAAPGTGTLLAVTAQGGAGNDNLAGSDSPDTLIGGSGNDTLTGNGGPDALDGELGDDSLRARDGGGDLVRGGPGNDSAETDATNVDIIDSVENISATPAADVKGTAVSVRSSRVALRRRRGGYTARISLQCPAAETGGCRGTLTLVSRRTVRIGGVRIAVVLGSARYNLRADQRRTISVRTPGGLGVIARRGTIAAQAHTITRDAAGNTAEARKNLTLRLAR